MFDRYPQTPTTKGHNQNERTQTTEIWPEVYLNATTTFAVKKDVSLSNIWNKQNIINLFSENLTNVGFRVIHVPDDFDILIAWTTLQCSKTKQVKVIGEDTGILVLLWHYVDKDLHKFVFQSEYRRWYIQHLTDIAGHMNKIILLMHAFLGCDAVSGNLCYW